MTAIAAKLTVGFIAGMTEKGRTETVDHQTEIGPEAVLHDTTPC